ncbi:MAG: cysteine peptidase family C39 domain-containing protein [Bacteroidota bacterium]
MKKQNDLLVSSSMLQLRFVVLFLIAVLINGCAVEQEREVPFIREAFPYECGPRCLQMIYQYHGVDTNFDQIARQTRMSPEEGTSFLSLVKSAEANDFKTLAVRLTYDNQEEDKASLLDVPLPCVAFWEGNYFIVVEQAQADSIDIIHPDQGKQ